MTLFVLSSSSGSAKTASTILFTALTRSVHHVFEYTSNVMLPDLGALITFLHHGPPSVVLQSRSLCSIKGDH